MPKTRLRSRVLALAMARTSARPRAVSMEASMAMGLSRPRAISMPSSMRATKWMSPGWSTLGTTTAASAAPAPSTTSRRSR